MNQELQKKVDEVVALYAVDKELLCKCTEEFVRLMDAGLADATLAREHMPMIPTYVTALPTGKEKGLYLAGDLGGTNFRVCLIYLNGNHTFKLEQEKFKIPLDLMQGSTGDQLFEYLASKVEAFLAEHHGEYLCAKDGKLKLGFTFSFPVTQTALGAGTLLRWTKGFDLPDVVGKDIVQLLQAKLDDKDLPVDVVALANDTVGTLLLRAYTNDESKLNANTVVGCIFGTGTNGAYYETADKIKSTKTEGGMVINTEWGSFDNTLKVLPVTPYDTIIDNETANKGYHLFEKRILGMFLGELLRVTLMDLFNKGFIFQDLYKQRGGTLPHRLTEAWLLDSAVLLYLEIDDLTELKMLQLILENELRLPTTHEERLVIQALTRAISSRAAYLLAIPIGAIVRRVAPQFADDDRDFEIGCDGSVVEFYPGFQDKIYEGLDMIKPLEGLKKKIFLRIAKDGSGVGAALCASVADKSS